ncbi:hypothetical protein Pcinc_008328 [Petrolisthes cinctipes]|uniref:Uncharacterized protein n=1 Tax=Petrolisthes cinctipes TaxID=88211 RepID=A0AAE1G6X4_PETCI|nr:hypothetical protein Pcinc_008328 [Petrolisthes cinctipes]
MQENLFNHLHSCHTTSTMKQSILLSALMVLVLVSILEVNGAKSGELLHPKIYSGQMKKAEILSISPQYFRVQRHHPYYPEARALMYQYFNSQYRQDPHYDINHYLQEYYDDTQSSYQFPYDPTGHGDPQFSFYQDVISTRMGGRDHMDSPLSLKEQITPELHPVKK